VDEDGYCATRTAAVGGDLWLAALFARPAHRPMLQALGALRADLVHLIAHRAEPQVIAARAGWWQQELSMLGLQPGQHPATRALAPLAQRDPALREALLEWTLHLNEEIGGGPVLDATRWRLHLLRAGRLNEAIALLTDGPRDATAELGATLAAIERLATLGERLAQSRPAREIGPAPELKEPTVEARRFVVEQARALGAALAAPRAAVARHAPLAVMAALGARRAARLARSPAQAWSREPARQLGAVLVAWHAARRAG
jgi:phytoene synthase